MNPAKITENSFLGENFLAGETKISIDNPQHIYRPQGMKNWIFHLTTFGKGKIKSGNDTLWSEPGNFYLFPPGVSHNYKMAGNEGWQHYWVYFKIDPFIEECLIFEQIGDGLYFGKTEGSDFEKACQCMKVLLSIFRDGDNEMEPVCNALLLTLLRFISIKSSTQSIHDSRIEKITRYLKNNFDKEINIGMLADYVGLSTSRLAHRFLETTGKPPGVYLEEIRIKHAKVLLTGTGLKMTEIAQRCGFNNPVWFNKVFKKCVGISPGYYRKGFDLPGEVKDNLL